MATFNRAHLIEETLKSIQKQTYSNWECLIIDDGSTDNTQTVLESYINKDPRLKYFLRTEKYKKGLPGCRNYGLDLSEGEYVIFFDDDDIVHPQNLAMCLETLDTFKTEFCVYKKQSFFLSAPSTHIYQKEPVFIEYLNKENLYDIITQKKPIASCTVMWHRACFEIHRFHESLMYAEEWELYSRIISTNITGVHIGNILYFNRKHAESNTGAFWHKNPVQVKSKINAAQLIIENLNKKNLLNYSFLKYFTSLALLLKEKPIFDYLLNVSSPDLFTRFKLNMRYHLHFIILPFYKFKKRFRPNSLP